MFIRFPCTFKQCTSDKPRINTEVPPICPPKNQQQMCCCCCLLLGGGSDLGLLGAAHLLHAVALLLALLASLLLLQVESVTLQAMFGLELLGKVECVVDESETGRLAATEVGAEAEDEAHVGSDLVHGGQLLADLLLVDRRQTGMENIADHLLAAQQTVRHELAGANGGCRRRHCGSV